MKIDLSKLAYNENNELLINEVISFDESYFESTDIRKISDVSVVGSVTFDDETYSLELDAKGKMILPCAISLIDVEYPFDIQINEIIDSNEEESEEYLKIIDNTLDIIPIIWQNIVVEIPMKVVSPNLDTSKLQGDGWKLLTDEEQKSELDPRLAKLKDLLDD